MSSLPAERRLQRARQALKRAETLAGVCSVDQRRLQHAASLTLTQRPVTQERPAQVAQDFIGQVVHVGSDNQQLFSAVSQMLPADGWAAFVGVANLGWVRASLQGIPLDRVLTVPRPGSHAADVIAVLLEGIDVVCVGPVALSFSQRRRLAARVRRDQRVLVTQDAWVGISMEWELDAMPDAMPERRAV